MLYEHPDGCRPRTASYTGNTKLFGKHYIREELSNVKYGFEQRSPRVDILYLWLFVILVYDRKQLLLTTTLPSDIIHRDLFLRYFSEINKLMDNDNDISLRVMAAKCATFLLDSEKNFQKMVFIVSLINSY